MVCANLILFLLLAKLMSDILLTSKTKYDRFLESPESVLEEEFVKSKKGTTWLPEQIFVSCSLMGIDGRTRYSSYKYVKREDLKNREYNLEFWDGQIAIHWTDVLHQPRDFKTIWKKDITMRDLIVNEIRNKLDDEVFNSSRWEPVGILLASLFGQGHVTKGDHKRIRSTTLRDYPISDLKDVDLLNLHNLVNRRYYTQM